MCDDFVKFLRKIDSADEKKDALIDNKEFINSLYALNTDKYQYERIFEEVTKQFPRGNKIGQLLKNIMEDKQKKKVEETLGQFGIVNIQDLDHGKDFQPYPTAKNFETILDKTNQLGIIWDAISNQVCFTHVPWQSDDKVEIQKLNDDDKWTYYPYNEYQKSCLMIYLNGTLFPKEIHWTALYNAVMKVAHKNKIDFYKEWMDDIKDRGDDIDRIGCEIKGMNKDNYKEYESYWRQCWAIKYLIAKDDTYEDVVMAIAWSRVILMNIIHRCYEPGCLTRYIFIIEGKERIGKSSLANELSPIPEWYMDAKIIDLQEPEKFNRSSHNKIIVEFPELSGLGATPMSTIKSASTSRYSPHKKMYKDDVHQYPRRSIWVGTLNKSHSYWRDTEATRLAIIKSEARKPGYPESIDHQGFREVYHLLLAQALKLYEQGVNQFFSPEEMKIQESLSNNAVVSSEEKELVEQVLSWRPGHKDAENKWVDTLPENNSMVLSCGCCLDYQQYADKHGIAWQEIVFALNSMNGETKDYSRNRIKMIDELDRLGYTIPCQGRSPLLDGKNVKRRKKPEK